MCTEGRRIESRSFCLTKPNQNHPNKIPRKTSLTHLECKPRGLMTETNNVCKTARQKMYAVFYDMKC